MTRILVIRYGGIGDTFLLTSFFQTLRKVFSPSELVAMGRKEALDILAHEGIVDTAVSFDQEGIWGFYNKTNRAPSRLKKFFLSFERIFSFVQDEDNLFHRNLTELVGGKVRSASPLPGKDYAGHAAKYYQEAFGLTLPDPETAPPLFHKSPEDVRLASQFFREHGMDPGEDRIIAIHPGSGSRLKNWPLERFVDVARHLAECGYQVLWLRGPAEDAPEAGFHGEWRGIFPVYLALGRLVPVLKSSSAYLGNDSGISHLAGLTGIPTFVIFGPTNPVRWGPLGRRVVVLARTPGPSLAPGRTGEDGRGSWGVVSVEAVLSHLGRELGAGNFQPSDNHK